MARVTSQHKLDIAINTQFTSPMQNVEQRGWNTYNEVRAQNVELSKTAPDESKRHSHHIVQHATVRDLPGYSKNQAPAVSLTIADHYLATGVQINAKDRGTLRDEYRVGVAALVATGMSPRQAAEEVSKAKDYFDRLGYGPDTPTRSPGAKDKNDTTNGSDSSQTASGSDSKTTDTGDWR